MKECNLDLCALNHEGYCTNTQASKACRAKTEKDLQLYNEELIRVTDCGKTE